MKLLHFLWSGMIGGSARSVYQLAREQLREDWDDVGVLFGRAEGPYIDLFRDLGSSVASVDARSGADLRLIPSIARRLAEYDVHHFHAIEPLVFAGSILSGRKVRVFTERGGVHEFESVKQRARYELAGPVLRAFFHGYSGNTAHAAAVAAALYGLPPERVAVTYNGIDFGLLSPRRSALEVRHELGVEADAVLIGTSGELRTLKRVDKLFEACAALGDVGYEVLVVGDGPDRARLTEVARRLGMGDRVRFTGMRSDVADYVAAMDVFVLPSNVRESFGNALVEAIGLGVPGVAFADSPGICEHIEPGETGFVASDVFELTAILKRLALDADLRRKVGDLGAQSVRMKYTPDRMASAYRVLYHDAVARAAARDSRRSLLRRLARAMRRDADPRALA